MPSPNAKATDVTNVQWAMMTQTGSRDFPYLESVEFAQLKDDATLPEMIVLGHNGTKRICAYLPFGMGYDNSRQSILCEEQSSTQGKDGKQKVIRTEIYRKDLDGKSLRYPFRRLASEGSGFTKPWDAKQWSDFVRACFISKGLTKDRPVNLDKQSMSALRAAIKKIVTSGHHTPKNTTSTSRFPKSSTQA